MNIKYIMLLIVYFMLPFFLQANTGIVLKGGAKEIVVSNDIQTNKIHLEGGIQIIHSKGISSKKNEIKQNTLKKVNTEYNDFKLKKSELFFKPLSSSFYLSNFGVRTRLLGLFQINIIRFKKNILGKFKLIEFDWFKVVSKLIDSCFCDIIFYTILICFSLFSRPPPYC